MNQLTRRLSVYGVAFAIALAVIGCATPSGRVVEHGFGFDVRWDSPGIEIMDFRYGSSPILATMGRTSRDATRPVAQYSYVYGPMQRPDRLLVQWRIRATGETLEDSVALERRLPPDIAGKLVHFVIKDRQLCVYLVSETVIPKEAPASPLSLYPRRLVNILYPDSPASSICQ